MTLATLVATVGVLFPLPAASQGPSGGAVTTGTRLRLTVPCASVNPSRTGVCRLEGALLSADGGVLALATGDSAVRQRLGDIRRIEVSRGRRSYWLIGAAAGLVVGTGVTYAILYSGGSTALCDQDANQDAIGSGECLGLLAGGALVGAGLGALAGTMIHAERWQDVAPGTLGVSFWRRSRQSVGVAVALRF